MQCVCQAPNCSWTMLMGCLRLTLFLITILLFFISKLNLLALYQAFNIHLDASEQNDNVATKIHLYVLFSLVAVMFGNYGAYRGSRYALSWFVRLSLAQAAIIVVLILAANSTGYFERRNEVFLHTMGDMQKAYVWPSEKTRGSNMDATIPWDRLQNGMCCGISGPHDWDPYRPANVSAVLYPLSCCRRLRPDEGMRTSCTSAELTKTMGCREKLESHLERVGDYFMMFAVLQVALAMIASTIKSHADTRVAGRTSVLSQLTIVPPNNKPQSQYYVIEH